jgi:hypothetical protein
MRKLVSVAFTLCSMSAAVTAQEKPVNTAEREPVATPQQPGDRADATAQPPLPLACSGKLPGRKLEDKLLPLHCAASATKNESGIHWGSLIGQWWFYIGIEHAERLIMQPKTRAQLSGRFFHDWLSDVTQYRYDAWDDGDHFVTSYLSHPLQGAVVEAIFWQNDDRVRFSDQDFHSAAYRKALLQAFAFATVDAVQWKLGPVSEATIGHVGLPAHWWEEPYNCKFFKIPCNPRTGLNDLVMNEVGGTAMTIGFQWLDKHVQKPMEIRLHNRPLINTMRILTNPPQSMANLFRLKRPWYRDPRDSQRR